MYTLLLHNVQRFIIITLFSMYHLLTEYPHPGIFSFLTSAISIFFWYKRIVNKKHRYMNFE